MFANISYEDKEAFFSLLDEYFTSRPHLLSSSSPAPSPSYAPSITSPSSRTLPPLAPARNRSHDSIPSPPSPAPKGPDTRTADEKREDMVMKFAMRSIKGSANTAGRGLSMVSRNSKAMGALDKYGAGGLVRGAEGVMNSGKHKKEEVHVQEAVSVTEKKGPPPAPAPKKSGIAGLGKSSFGGMFGHSKETSNSDTLAPPVSTSSTNLAPPKRTVAQPETEDTGAEGQAQALYDYTGGDAGDLSVQSGQIVNLLEKTSDDWWTCEDGNGSRGLVPAAYLKEI